MTQRYAKIAASRTCNNKECQLATNLQQNGKDELATKLLGPTCNNLLQVHPRFCCKLGLTFLASSLQLCCKFHDLMGYMSTNPGAGW
jgi:hypothetical protein